MKLHFKDGLYLPSERIASWIDRRAADGAVEELFLQLLVALDAQGRNVSHKTNAPTYAPAVFSKEPKAVEKRIHRKDFEGAMLRLFNAEKIHVGMAGKASRQVPKIMPGKRPNDGKAVLL